MTTSFKYFIISSVALLLSGCSLFNKKDKEDLGNYKSYWYYYYEATDVLDGTAIGVDTEGWVPRGICISGDTIFVGNNKDGERSVVLLDKNTLAHIATIDSWVNGSDVLDFSGSTIESLQSDGQKLYVCRNNSIIDVFELPSLKYITRVGDGNWGTQKYRIFQPQSICVNDGWLISREKNRYCSHMTSAMIEGTFQNVPFFARTNTIDSNNGFVQSQMVVDTCGEKILATDFTKKIVTIDMGNVNKALDGSYDAIFADEGVNMQTSFTPIGIALNNERMFISELNGNNGKIHIYDRAQKEFVNTLGTVKGFTFKRPEHLAMSNDHIFVTDYNAKRLVRLTVYKTEIREYEELSPDLVIVTTDTPATEKATYANGKRTLVINTRTHEVVSEY